MNIQSDILKLLLLNCALTLLPLLYAPTAFFPFIPFQFSLRESGGKSSLWLCSNEVRNRVSVFIAVVAMYLKG